MIEKGMRFGRLVAIEPTEERTLNNGIIWKCQCDCGNIKMVPANYLTTGTTQSCGCLNGKNKLKIKAGQKFNRLSAIEPTEDRRGGSVVWRCQCECGNIAYVTAGELNNGIVKSCGCLPVGKHSTDLAGQRFGVLQVLKKTDRRKGSNVVWECKCDCGNIVYISGANLKRGATKSCGCKKRQNLSGKRFGHLIAIQPTEKREKRYVVWECQCDCGNIVLVDVNSLSNNRVQSCGCVSDKRKINAKNDDQLPEDINFTINFRDLADLKTKKKINRMVLKKEPKKEKQILLLYIKNWKM